MLYSMTGYGRAEQTIGEKVFLIELRSLNGKQFDVNESKSFKYLKPLNEFFRKLK